MCKLTSTPGNFDCQLSGKTDEEATLSLSAAAGAVVFGETTYGAVQVVAQGQTATEIKIKIQAGTQRLSTVYLFSLGDPGRGKLLENCEGGTTQELRDDLRGDQPFVSYQVCGRDQ